MKLRLNNGFLTKKVEVEEYALSGSIVTFNTKLKLSKSEICVKSKTTLISAFKAKSYEVECEIDIDIPYKRTNAEGCTLFMYIYGQLDYDCNSGVPSMQFQLARKVSCTAMLKKQLISKFFVSTW